LFFFATSCARSDVLDARDFTNSDHKVIDAGVPDAGPPDAGQITPEPDGGYPCESQDSCPRGFTCDNGICILDGALGPIQVTLNWSHVPRTPEDLDLHLLEPLPGGGSCEIYFADPNQPGFPSSCGAVGSLDLDANPACAYATDGPGLDTENIIYPANVPAPKGHYVVKVDYYEDCTLPGATSPNVQFTVTVRKGNVSTNYVGLFLPGDADTDTPEGGRMVAEFDVP
jgi:hypothetical protein